MTFCVRDLQGHLSSLDPDLCIKLDSFPEDGSSSLISIKSSMGLLHKNDLFQGCPNSVVKRTFCVVCIQSEASNIVLSQCLYESDNRGDAETAFSLLRKTLGPLLDGSIKLNKDLLEVAILPIPLSPKEFCLRIVEVMESHTNIHFEWHRIVQVLLHSACSRESRDEVDLLLRKGGDLEEEDRTGNTPLESAMSHMSGEGLDWLMDIAKYKLKKTASLDRLKKHKSKLGKKDKRKPTALSEMTKVGGIPLLFGLPETIYKSSDTLLHKAVRSNNPEDIWSMVEKRQSFLLSSSSEYFSIPGSPRPDPVEDISFDVLDDNGDTPLMVAIYKSYIKSSYYLLLGGADPNFPHPDTGDTALHLAVEHDNFELVKLLLVFEADPTIRNNNGEKPIDKADLPNYVKYEIVFNEITELTRAASQLPLMPDHPTLPQDAVCLLSLDGGGIRALTLIQFLVAIERRMKLLNPDCKSLMAYFDYVVATSGGSFIPLFNIYGQIPVESYFALMFTGIIQAFTGTKDRGKCIENLLISGVGADTVMTDIKHPRIIVTTTLADRIPCSLHLITNYGEARDGQKGPSERKVWEAGRMSSSAPIYFMPYENKFLDGAIMANNPTLVGMTEVVNQAERDGVPCNLKFVLSLGTGIPPEVPIDKIAIVPPSFTLSGLWNLKDNFISLKNVFFMLFEQLSSANGQEVEKAKAFCKVMGATYHRFCAPLSKEINIVDTDLVTIIDMLYDCRLYILREAERINSIAHQLLSKPMVQPSVS